MLSNQIESVFDTVLNSPEGAEATIYFTSDKVRESVRVRFIALKTKYEKQTGKSAPIEVARITSVNSYPGVSIKKISDSKFIAFIKIPGEDMRSLELPSSRMNPQLPEDSMFVNTEDDYESARIAELLRKEGIGEKQICDFFTGEDVPNLNLDELMQDIDEDKKETKE